MPHPMRAVPSTRDGEAKSTLIMAKGGKALHLPLNPRPRA